MDVQIEDSWKKRLAEEFEKPYFVQLTEFVRNEYRAGTCYPPGKLIFNAFNQCPFDEAKVVIIGQDPYHGPGQAHGLCFSVNDGVRFPPSLQNIFKEIQNDLGIPVPATGNLTRWAEQGVFLLNTILTVEHGLPLSHKNKGWEIFTTSVIKELNNDDNPKVFVLWGKEAQKLKEYITNEKHLIIESNHPSPLSASRGFFGSKPFSKINNFLISNNLEPIDFSR
jgi:uracil-DNA glycosylase